MKRGDTLHLSDPPPITEVRDRFCCWVGFGWIKRCEECLRKLREESAISCPITRQENEAR